MVVKKVEETSTVKDMMIERLKKKYEEERIGVHATDLLFPRQTVFRKLNGSQVTERDVVYYALGAGEGEAIESLLGMSEVIAVSGGIVHDIDSVIEENGKLVPIEIKTTRAEVLEPKKHYLTQLGLYALALEVNYGYLVIIGLNAGIIKTFRVEFDLNEVRRLRDEAKRKVFQALAEKDPSKAPCVWRDFELNWKCYGCDHREECKKVEKVRKFSFRFSKPLYKAGSFEAEVISKLNVLTQIPLYSYEVVRNEKGEVVEVRFEVKEEESHLIFETLEKVNSKLK
jgi:hypothetical protein